MSEDHHHEAFDAEPTRELSPGEPRTPMWLTALGVALFTVGGVYWAASGDDDAPTPEVAPSASVPVAAVPAPAAPPRASVQRIERPARPPRPAGSQALRPSRVGSEKPADAKNPVRRLNTAPAGTP